ncbi:MAG: FkbM family methyltransferase [Porticoccus sp.]|jgi:FkbM family methyltransferase
MQQKLHLDIAGMGYKFPFYIHKEGDNHVSKKLLEQGIWEAYETELFLACLQQDYKVLDIGANIGYYAVLAGLYLGDKAQVLAYEPNPENFALLDDNIKINSCANVQAFQLALSNIDNDGFLFLSADNFGDHQIYDNNEHRHKQPISLVNGDTHTKQFLHKVNLIKIDTQGAEWQVLQGIKELIKNSLPQLQMILEFSPNSLRLAGSKPDDLLQYIFSLKLPIAMIDHIGHQLIPTSFKEMKAWSDATKPDINDLGFFNLFIGKPPF